MEKQFKPGQVWLDGKDREVLIISTNARHHFQGIIQNIEGMVYLKGSGEGFTRFYSEDGSYGLDKNQFPEDNILSLAGEYK